ncbi:hypothetical protein RFI_10936, partial [Reticulomyxa filosa]
ETSPKLAIQTFNRIMNYFNTEKKTEIEDEEVKMKTKVHLELGRTYFYELDDYDNAYEHYNNALDIAVIFPQVFDDTTVKWELHYEMAILLADKNFKHENVQNSFQLAQHHASLCLSVCLDTEDTQDILQVSLFFFCVVLFISSFKIFDLRKELLQNSKADLLVVFICKRKIRTMKLFFQKNLPKKKRQFFKRKQVGTITMLLIAEIEGLFKMIALTHTANAHFFMCFRAIDVGKYIPSINFLIPSTKKSKFFKRE